MRFLTASLLALGFGSTIFSGSILGGSIVAHAETPPPTKTIQIWNNEPKGSSTVVYPVLEVGIKSSPVGDNWMIGWFNFSHRAATAHSAVVVPMMGKIARVIPNAMVSAILCGVTP